MGTEALLQDSRGSGTFLSSRGKRLRTSFWSPETGQPKALVLLCHGYTLNCSKYFRGTAEALAAAGYAVYGMDYEGHGESEGARGIVWSLEDLVEDCLAYFAPIRDAPESRAVPRFLVGESLGGAVVQGILHREQQQWAGAILLAPLFLFPEKELPPPCALALLLSLSRCFPRWALAPPLNVAEKGLEDPAKRVLLRKDPLIYHGRTRLISGAAFLEACSVLQARAPEIDIPLLILHGDHDLIIEAKGSEVLFGAVASSDKCLKVYPGMWHLLTEGAPVDHAQIVLKEMLEWLDARVQ